jgi:GntR family transcriptional regulator/MocR family aminotransferase
MTEACSDGLLEGGQPRLFRPGAVAADLFPAREWARASGRVWRRDGASLVHYGDPHGYLPLREQIADHLTRNRGVKCEPEQIAITSGSQHALNLLIQLLLDPGEAIAVEDPGYLGVHAALRCGGLDPVPVPVDADGLDVPYLEVGDVAARALYTTPSHQYPLGVTLPLERRLRLVEWARSGDVWIIEDDYDSEFRYESRPLPALQGLDPEGRVVHVGTFSKVLAPSLRIGFVVLPPALVHAFGRMVAAHVYHASVPLQATLAEFMADGHLERHIRRLRTHYGARWATLKEALERHLASRVDILPGAAGLHLTVLLGAGVDDREVARRAAENGLEVSPLSLFFLGSESRSGLVLGFGAADTRELDEGVQELARILDRARPEKTSPEGL